MQPKLLDETRRLLNKAPRHLSIKQIATEACLPYAWVTKFSTDKTWDPGVRKVQALYDYLNVVPHTKPVSFQWTYADMPDLPGVYEITDSEGLHVYVGQTNNLRRRIDEHRRCPDITSNSPARVRFTEVHDQNLIDWLEIVRINAYNPTCNIQRGRTRVVSRRP